MDTTMELDELKQAWQTLDKRLQQQNSLQFDAFRERKAGIIKASLRPLFWGQLVQMLFGIATVVVGVWLWKNFSTISAVLVAGIIVHLYGVATIIASGAVLGGISKIDRSLPVLALQQRLATLRRAYIVGGAVVGLPWWLLWMVPPVVVMSLHAQQTGATVFSPTLLGWSAVGVAGLLGTLWFHRWSRKPGREALAKRLDDGAAGGSLRRAQAELDALKAYEIE
jgi:hypothetical protein